MHKISNELWVKLEKLLNYVANERVQDYNGPGSFPSGNANRALSMIKLLGMRRNKPKSIL